MHFPAKLANIFSSSLSFCVYQEFRVLLNWVSCQKLYNHKEDFENNVVVPIRQGGSRSASKRERETAQQTIEKFRSEVAGYILQRSMREHFQQHLPPKEEYVVFIRPSDDQWASFQKVCLLQGDREQKRKIFPRIMVQRLLCCHPKLVCKESVSDLVAALESKGANDDDDGAICDEHVYWDLHSADLNDIFRDSPRIRVCITLLQHFIQYKHKTLIFSFFKGHLDILQYVMEKLGINYCRVDGSTPDNDRVKIFERFSHNQYDVMLITINVGGLGLNLQTADRVILLAPM
jgi:DNA repair and recombination protein RAD54B